MQKRIWFTVFLVIGIGLAYAWFSYSANDTVGDNAGAESCKACHAKQYGSYKKSIHGNKAVASASGVDACKVCHSNGDKHVEMKGGKGSGIFTFNKKLLLMKVTQSV